MASATQGSALSAQGRRLPLGTILQGRYQLGELIARGKSSEVYAATDKQAPRPVAIKVLAPVRQANAAAPRRMQREAIALRRARHVGVVELFDSGTHEGSPYLVLEHLQGRSLAGLLTARGQFPVSEVVALGLGLAEVVDHCHVTGVVHRNLKPSNFFVAPGGGLKLFDFAAASVPEQFEEEQTRGLTRESRPIGTLEYTAPEALNGLPSNDWRLDVYSLGVTLFELLTGTVPFEGPLPNLIIAQSRGPAPVVTTRRQDIPDSVAVVIERCLTFEPNERYASMAELSLELELSLDFPTLSLDAPPGRNAPHSGVVSGRARLEPTPLPPGTPESRRYRRASYTTPAVLTPTQTEPISGRLEEISEGGGQFLSDRPVTPGTAGGLRFAMPVSGKVYVAKVRTSWSRAGRGNLHAIGFEFLDLDAEGRTLLQKYLALMDSESGSTTTGR